MSRASLSGPNEADFYARGWRALAAQVIYQALWDALGDPAPESGFVSEASRERERLRDDARRWILSEQTGVGSLEWWCAVHEYNAEAVRRALARCDHGEISFWRSVSNMEAERRNLRRWDTSTQLG